MPEERLTVTDVFTLIIDALTEVLRLAGQIEHPDKSPMVREMIRQWTATMQGRSLGEGVALLFVGAIALKAEWEEAMAVQGQSDHLLSYASLPEIKVN